MRKAFVLLFRTIFAVLAYLFTWGFCFGYRYTSKHEKIAPPEETIAAFKKFHRLSR